MWQELAVTVVVVGVAAALVRDVAGGGGDGGGGWRWGRQWRSFVTWQEGAVTMAVGDVVLVVVGGGVARCGR